MADTKLAKVGITVKESWKGDISYEVLDYTLWRVQDGGDGCGYIAKRANIGVRPDSDDSVWIKATQAGQSIYDLAVKYGHFAGTEEEFEAEYQAALQAARDAASETSATNTEIQEAEELRKTAENARVEAETARQTAESARRTAETARETAESGRQTAEAQRSENETNRQSQETARQNAEQARRSNETARENAEQERTADFEGLKTDMQTAIQQADAATAAADALNNQVAGDESARQTAESGRVAAETQRQTAETQRGTNEQTRQTQETARQAAEQTRNTQEGTRQTQEEARQTAEQGRASAESQRVSNETARLQAETAREEQSTSDHQRAEDDHAQAQDDHEVMEGYDTRLTNAETEVSQLRQEVTADVSQLEAKVGKIEVESEETKTSEDFTQGEYYNSSGVIASATIASRIEIGNLLPGTRIVTNARTGNTDMRIAYFQGTSVLRVEQKLTTQEEELDIPDGTTMVGISNNNTLQSSPVVKVYTPVLIPSKQYIDTTVSGALESAETYADNKAHEALEESKEYTDQAISDFKVEDSRTDTYYNNAWEQGHYYNVSGVKGAAGAGAFCCIELPISQNTLSVEIKSKEAGAAYSLIMKDDVVVQVLPQSDGQSARIIDLSTALQAGANRLLVSHWVANAGTGEYVKIVTRIATPIATFVQQKVATGVAESKQYTDTKIASIKGIRKRINRYVNWVGTSIWAVDKSSGSAVMNGYQTLIKEQFDFSGDSGTTKSYSGFGLCGDGNGNYSIAASKMSTWTATEGDIWTLDTNTNDHTLGAPLGTYDDDFVGNTGPNTFYGALRMFRDKVLELSGQDAIVICSNQIQHGAGDYDYQNRAGLWVHDYEVALCNVAAKNGWYFVDQSPNCGLDKYVGLHFLKDGQHPNDAGYRVIVKPWIAQFDILYNKLLQEELDNE